MTIYKMFLLTLKQILLGRGGYRCILQITKYDYTQIDGILDIDEEDKKDKRIIFW